MARNRELNRYRISNPDGLSRRHDEFNRRTFQDMRPNSIREDSSRSFREIRRVSEYYKRRRSAKPKKQRAQRDKKQKARLARSMGASAAGHVLLVFAAVVFCSYVYVSSLTIRVRPCSSMAESLAFQTSFRNPDETPLRAVLYSEQERYDKDFVGVAYLLFDGLQKKSEYVLSIRNIETREEIYNSTFLTEADDPYQINVENPHVTPEGVFEFGLQVSGLEAKDFYTVFVMDPNGKKVAVLDGSDAQASFSIPIKSMRPSEDAEQQPGVDGEPSGVTGESSGASGGTSGTTGQSSGGTGGTSGGTGGTPGQSPGETGEPPDVTGQPPDVTGEPPDATQEPDVTGEPSETEEVDIDTMPFITVRINGRTFLPKVWNNDPEPVPDPVAETVSDEIEWIWNEDRTEAEALIPDPENPGEIETVVAEVTETVAKEPQCEEEGLAVYTAVAPLPDGTRYQDVRTEVIPATGHRYERVRLSETGNQTSAEYVCPDCGKVYFVDATVTQELD